MLQRFLRTVSIFVALALLSGCDQNGQQQLKIAFSEEAHHQIFHLVRNQQFDLGSGIELELFPTTSPTRTSRLFRNGIVDFGVLDLDGALTLAESENITIVGAIGRMQGTRALLARPDIESVADLRGKKIGVYRGSNQFLYGSLNSAGLSQSDVEFVYVPNIENERSIRNGEIDALVALEPRATRLKRSGLRELYNASETPLKPIYVLFARTAFVQAYPETIPALIKTWETGIQYSFENPQLAAGALGSLIGLSAQDFQHLIDRFEPNMDLSKGFPWEASLDPERMDPRFFDALKPTDGGTPKIVLYWQK